jgi:ABC-2 type transport system ATP-binding protein
MLTSILTPTSGEIEIDGERPDLNRKQYVKRIGAMFGQKTQLWWDLPLQDSYLLLKDMYEIDEKTYRENMALFCDVLGIDQFLHQPVRQLSLGQRVRGDLAAVLLHNPKVVFLDEPTLGIDFVAKKKIRQFIRAISDQRHVTLLLTSHDIADIESLCDRIIILNGGKVAYDGTMAQLRDRYASARKLEVEFAEVYPDFEVAGAELITSDGNKKVFSFPAGVSPSPLIAEMGRNRDIANLTIREPSIEDVIGQIYQRDRAVPV